MFQNSLIIFKNMENHKYFLEKENKSNKCENII